MMASSAHATHGKEIRVLIVDEGFREPGKNEVLKPFDDLEGRLMLGDYSYIGTLKVWSGAGGLYLVNAIPLEEYVKGTVQAEVARDWAREALKAQAVIARTFVLSKVLSPKRAEYDISSSTLDQMFKGLTFSKEVEDAVNSTKGEVLTYGGKLIDAKFHSTSVGRTEDYANVFGGKKPYLVSVSSSGRLSPMAFWQRRIPLREIGAETGLTGVRDVRVTKRNSTGRADEVTVVTKESDEIIKATTLRQALGWTRLPSTDFDVFVKDGEAVFDGRGWGHGVGLCQWTALEMALDGKNYKEILAHFYPGAELTINENR